MTRSRSRLALMGAAGLFAIAVAAAPGSALLVPYFLASWSASIPLLTCVSLASSFLVFWLCTGLAARLWGAKHASRFSAQAAGVMTLALGTLLYWLILKPTAIPPKPIAYDNTRYWQLPTGSKIAYSEFDPPPGMPIEPDPIVFLHGGPGLRQAPFDQSIYGRLSHEGFRVFLYDQAGAGLSDFLPELSDYTFKRMVDDLEAIRKKLGADKMILIGHSWGSTLAATYMARYPGHVAKVIFHSPGDIWNWGPFDYSRTDAPRFPPFPGLRMYAALMLNGRNPKAAEHLVSQREMEGLNIRVLNAQLGTIVCKGDSHRLPPEIAAMRAAHENPGFNPYVGWNIQWDDDDPHDALRKDSTPAILLYPECNFIPWSGALDYRNTLPNLKIYYIPRAGHYIQIEQPELMRRIMVAFLLDQPDVIPPYEGTRDPRLAAGGSGARD
jgi:pimeloyl-ACP methyl ester carboxylesterase